MEWLPNANIRAISFKRNSLRAYVLYKKYHLSFCLHLTFKNTDIAEKEQAIPKGRMCVAERRIQFRKSRDYVLLRKSFIFYYFLTYLLYTHFSVFLGVNINLC